MRRARYTGQYEQWRHAACECSANRAPRRVSCGLPRPFFWVKPGRLRSTLLVDHCFYRSKGANLFMVRKCCASAAACAEICAPPSGRNAFVVEAYLQVMANGCVVDCDACEPICTRRWTLAMRHAVCASIRACPRASVLFDPPAATYTARPRCLWSGVEGVCTTITNRSGLVARTPPYMHRKALARG